jgi:hypothetical protein
MIPDFLLRIFARASCDVFSILNFIRASLVPQTGAHRRRESIHVKIGRSLKSIIFDERC